MAHNVGNTPAFSPGLESSTQRQIVMLECATEPYNPHLLVQAVDEGGNDGGMEKTEREERRQNDGVAIKYTAGSEEHAGCCWEAVLRWHIGALFLSILVPRLLDSVLSVARFFSLFTVTPFVTLPHFSSRLHFPPFMPIVLPPVVISVTLHIVPPHNFLHSISVY